MEDHRNNPDHPDQWPMDQAITPLAFETYGAMSDTVKDLIRVAAAKFESLNVDSGFDQSTAAVFRSKHSCRIATTLAVGGFVT